VRGADGSRLTARLAPLHAGAERQAFEAGSLARRLSLPPGEPWRLTLSWDLPDPRATPPARDPEDGEPAGVGLGSVEVHDPSGTALRSIPDRSGTVPDPLRTLLRPPAGALRQGEEVEWVLWGRAPVAPSATGAEVVLVGLLPPGGPEAEAFEEATGLRGPLALSPEPVRRRDLWLPMARLDRPSLSGKTRGSGSSEESLGSRTAENP
jgi:hypothetical protein